MIYWITSRESGINIRIGLILVFSIRQANSQIMRYKVFSNLCLIMLKVCNYPRKNFIRFAPTRVKKNFIRHGMR